MNDKAGRLNMIVVAYDDTNAAKRALERAVELAEKFDARLCVVSVVPIVYGIRGGPLDPGDSKERHDEQLGSARAFLEARSAEAEFIEGFGDPGEVIIDTAEAKDAQLIVMGSRTLSMFERLLGQSVSTYVQRNTRCDVLCIH